MLVNQTHPLPRRHRHRRVGSQINDHIRNILWLHIRLVPASTRPLSPTELRSEMYVVSPSSAPLEWRLQISGKDGATHEYIRSPLNSVLLHDGDDVKLRLRLPRPNRAGDYIVRLFLFSVGGRERQARCGGPRFTGPEVTKRSHRRGERTFPWPSLRLPRCRRSRARWPVGG